MPEGPAVGRVEAERRALTMPSTAPASNARWWNVRNRPRHWDISPKKTHDACQPIAVRFVDRLFPCIRRTNVHVGGAFLPHNYSTKTTVTGHDQRWRERPRLDGLGSPSGQDTGVVHAIVGSPTAIPTPTVTAAKCAASIAPPQQSAAIQTLARSERSWSHQG